MKHPQKSEYLVRYGAPNEYDQAPHGKRCISIGGSGEPVYFIQASKDEEHPKWVLLDFPESELLHPERLRTDSK